MRLCPLREPIGHRTGSSAGIVAGSAGCHTRSLHSDGGASKRSYALGGASWWFKPQGPFIPMPRTIPQSADGQVATAHNGRRLSTASVIWGLKISGGRRILVAIPEFSVPLTPKRAPGIESILGALLFKGIDCRNANLTSVTTASADTFFNYAFYFLVVEANIPLPCPASRQLIVSVTVGPLSSCPGDSRCSSASTRKVGPCAFNSS